MTELLKLRTIRSPWVLLALAQAVVLLGVAGRLTNPKPGIDAEAAAAGHVGVIALFSLVLGILAVAGEYRHRTITDTYLGHPRRWRVLAAKLGVYTLAGVLLAVVGAVVALVSTWLWLTLDGTGMNWSDAELWRTLAGALVWNGTFAAIGVGLGALVRNLTAALAGALAWIALVEGLLGQLIGTSASRWLPFAAGTAVDRATTGGLPQWGAKKKKKNK
jgi:ABC-2 type transport system permease protein